MCVFYSFLWFWFFAVWRNLQSSFLSQFVSVALFLFSLPLLWVSRNFTFSWSGSFSICILVVFCHPVLDALPLFTFWKIWRKRKRKEKEKWSVEWKSLVHFYVARHQLRARVYTFRSVYGKSSLYIELHNCVFHDYIAAARFRCNIDVAL